MKEKGSFYFTLLFIRTITSVKHLDGLETTFNLFENKCFINIIFLEFTANFILHDTPILQTFIDVPKTALNKWSDELVNPRNKSLWPSWKIKHLECVLNTFVIPKNNWSKVLQMRFWLEVFS